MARSLTTRAVAVVLFSLAATLAAHNGSAAPRQDDQGGDAIRPRILRVRGADQRARSLLQEGASRSGTFRGLLEALDRSDVIVYLETGPLDRPGALLFVSSGGARFLRILVRASGRPDDEVIAWIGHELQHAVEISATPDVKDDNGVLRLFRRIGFTSRSTCETKEAERVWRRVLDEVRYGARCGHR